MTRERYTQWLAVWKWFQTQPSTPELGDLYMILNKMWQQDRLDCDPDALAAYSQPLDLDTDPNFRKFLDDLNKGFGH